MKFDLARRLEPRSSSQSYVHEFWNTWSNLPFVILGILRMLQWNQATEEAHCVTHMYLLFALAGLCSGIHHAFLFPGSIVLDWIPIVISLFFWVEYEIWKTVTYGSWFQLGLAFSILGADHLVRLVPVPWGHVMWHFSAAQAIDSAYMDFAHHLFSF